MVQKEKKSDSSIQQCVLVCGDVAVRYSGNTMP